MCEYGSGSALVFTLFAKWMEFFPSNVSAAVKCFFIAEMFSSKQRVVGSLCMKCVLLLDFDFLKWVANHGSGCTSPEIPGLFGEGNTDNELLVLLQF